MGLELAEGLPRSGAREKQLEELQNDSTFKLNNPDCPKGSDVWKEVSHASVMSSLLGTARNR